MKKKIKRRCIAAGVIILIILLLIKCFPTLFWKWHAKATQALAAKHYEGENDLEYAYSDDEHASVKKTQITAERTYTIFYPERLEKDQAVYPVVVWGNGTGNTYLNYEAGLTSLASYGFIVIGCDESNMGDGKALYEMGLFARTINADKDSIFYHRIDEEAIGAAGHSQGACGAVNAVTKYPESHSLFKSVYTTSMPKLEMCKDDDNYQFAYWQYDVSQITVPYFATSGTWFLDSKWIAPLSSMQDNFAQLGRIEAYMARQIHGNHNIVNEYQGAGYFNAWFCYTLKNDKKASEVFTGKQELKTNTRRWQDFAAKE